MVIGVRGEITTEYRVTLAGSNTTDQPTFVSSGKEGNRQWLFDVIEDRMLFGEDRCGSITLLDGHFTSLSIFVVI